jgi:hypothetical protein
MGGRGASSGMSEKGKHYGSEFRSVLQDGNIKFVKPKSGSATAPLETMTRGRVYVTVNAADELKFISYYDNQNKRTKTIDLTKPHKGVLPHTHHGYEHFENDSKKGFANLTTEEKAMVARVRKLWYNRHSK